MRIRRAQALLEYALILMLASIVAAVLLYIFGPKVGNMFSNVISHI